MAGQEDDCDSLEQILRTIKQNDGVNNTFSSSSPLNHNASSFSSVGGRISTVVDPEFRPPTVIYTAQANNNNNQTGESFTNLTFIGQQQIQQTMQNNNNNQNPNNIYPSSSIQHGMVINNLVSSGYDTNLNTNQQHMAGQVPMQNSMAPQTNRIVGPGLSSQIPVSRNLSVAPAGTFAVQGAPSTFQDIARRPTPVTGYSMNPMNIMSSTLNEYGPPVNHDPQRQRGPVFISHQNYSLSSPIRPPAMSSYPMGPAQMVSMSINTGPPARPASTGMNYDRRPMGPAPLGPAVVHQTSTTVMTSSSSTKEISPPPPPPPEPSESHNKETSSNMSSHASKDQNQPSRPSSVPTARPSSSGDQMIYSPMTKSSPPLDQIVAPTGRSQNDKQPTNNPNSLARIPRKRDQYTEKDNLDCMTLVELQGKYRDYEFDIHSNYKRLESIENQLNDLQRSAKGKNIELDPKCIKLQGGKKAYKEDTTRLNNKMTKISDKLWSKFQYKMNKNEVRSSAIARASTQRTPKRAKMSTTSQRESEEPRSRSREKLTSLGLKFGDTWCEKCREHFDSLNDYCDHLHSRDHKRQMSDSIPWAKSSSGLEKSDQRQTFHHLKSICSKVSSNLKGDSFDLRDLDRVLNHSLEDRDKVLKIRQLERERNKIGEEDPLFHYQCYDYLVPISGFYCILCSQALCDKSEVEQHMKSYLHTMAHLNSVALNLERFKTFIIRKDKSHKEIFGDKQKQSPSKSKSRPASTNNAEQESSRSDPIPSTSGTARPVRVYLPNSEPSVTTSGIIDVSTSTSTATTSTPASSSNVVNLNPRITNVSASATSTTTTTSQYKKATSHIVDQHEAVIEKYPSSFLEAQKAAHESLLKRKEPPTVVNEPPRKKASTEIIALGEMNRPTALKRLKKSARPVKSKAIVESSDTDSDFDIREKRSEPKKRGLSVVRDDDEDEQTAIESPDSGDESHLCKGNPDSPFPNLDLSVTGNVHVSALKDPRLKAKCYVKLKLLKFEDYKDMLLDSTTVWMRLNQLVAKKEPGQLTKEAREKIQEPVPTFYDPEGNCVPVEIEDENEGSQNAIKRLDKDDAKQKGKKDDKSVDHHKSKTTDSPKKSNKDSGDRTNKQDQKSTKDDKTKQDDAAAKSDDMDGKTKEGPQVLEKDEDEKDGSIRYMQQMELLEAFFCEKQTNL